MGKNLEIAEYEPLRIKLAVTGIGRAPKEQVRRTVCGILGVGGNISYDESDAIAAALCHGWMWKFCCNRSVLHKNAAILKNC
jgi:crossover junction endodeoxyribonuclease RuvC